MLYQASRGSCDDGDNGMGGILSVTSQWITKMPFKVEKLHSVALKWEKMHDLSFIHPNILRTLYSCDSGFVSGRSLAEKLWRLIVFIYLQCVHMLSHQFLSLEGKKKHSLSTWQSELSTQSTSNSPCINPHPYSLCRTALKLFQMVICSCWRSLKCISKLFWEC